MTRLALVAVVLAAFAVASTVAQYNGWQARISCPNAYTTGSYSYAADCSKFISCRQGKAVLLKCAPSTLFNPKTRNCDWRGNVDCGYRGYYYSNNHELSCPVRGASGLFPYPPDCSQFFNCANGKAYLQSCGSGTVFNPKTLACDWPYNVQCGNDPYRVTCPPYATGLFAYVPDCSKFINCGNGGEVLQDCGPGTVFNPLTRVCDWPYNVQCGIDPSQEGPNYDPNYPPIDIRFGGD